MSQPVEQLINESRLFYQSLVQMTEDLHQDIPISVGMRAVLEFLLINGAETVPNMARQRRVTRQRIQLLINQLMELDLVTARDNPATKRSPLIELTEKGREQIKLMRREEASVFNALDIPESRLRDAVEVLKLVRGCWEASDD